MVRLMYVRERVIDGAARVGERERVMVRLV